MNWVGGVRNRLKGSLHNERKAQRMYFERKKQERAASAAASRNPSDVKVPRRGSKRCVSQDVLSFKLQSEINEKNDVNTGHNFRVVNLGPTKHVPSVKNGVNVVMTRRVDHVNLPVSPIETPSVLDLSGCSSPRSYTNRDKGNPTYQDSLAPSRTVYATYNRCTDDKNYHLKDGANTNSTLIHLFGMPVDKPVRNEKSAAYAEPRHNYTVSSDRACRKSSCTMTTCGKAPLPADEILQNSTQGPSATETHTDTRHILPQKIAQSLPFTKPAILNQSSTAGIIFPPNVDSSDHVKGLSESFLIYSPTALNCDKCRHPHNHDYNRQDEELYVSGFPDVPNSPMPDLSDAAFDMNRDMNSFEVNLINSPHYRKQGHIFEARSTKYSKEGQLCPTQNSRIMHALVSTSNDCSGDRPDYSLNIRDPMWECVPFTDNLITGDTEFYGGQQEDITYVSSPHSPPKPVFLLHSKNYYFPQGFTNRLPGPGAYVETNESLSGEQLPEEWHYQEPLIPLLNQRGSVMKHTYNETSTAITSTHLPVNMEGSSTAVFYSNSTQMVGKFHNQGPASHERSADQQNSHRTETYLVTSGLDSTPCEGKARRDDDNSYVFDWHPTFKPGHHDLPSYRKGSSSISSGESKGDKRFVSKKPLTYLSRADQQEVNGQKITGSCNMLPDLEIKDGIRPRDSQHKETKMIANKLNDYGETEWLSGINSQSVLSATPVMASTPRCQQTIPNINKHHPQLVSAKMPSSLRDHSKIGPATQVLLEMSVLENQAQSEKFAGQLMASFCNRLSEAESTSQVSLTTRAAQNAHTYLMDSTNDKPSLQHSSTLTTQDKKTFRSAPLHTSSNNDPSKTSPSQDDDNNILYTPAQSLSSTETRAKSPPSASLMLETQVPPTDGKDVCTHSCSQNNSVSDEGRLESCSSQHRNNVLESRLQTDNSNSGTGVGPLSSVGQVSVARKHKLSTGTQTTPKHVQDAGCSPIRVFSKEGQHRQSQLTLVNHTDNQGCKIYCLRPRNKIE